MEKLKLDSLEPLLSRCCTLYQNTDHLVLLFSTLYSFEAQQISIWSDAIAGECCPWVNSSPRRSCFHSHDPSVSHCVFICTMRTLSPEIFLHQKYIFWSTLALASFAFKVIENISLGVYSEALMQTPNPWNVSPSQFLIDGKRYSPHRWVIAKVFVK